MANKGRQMETRYYNQEKFEDGRRTRRHDHVGVTDVFKSPVNANLHSDFPGTIFNKTTSRWKKF